MDLRGLESIQWRGFSDREIQRLQKNLCQNQEVLRSQKEVNVPKVDQRVDDSMDAGNKEDDHHSCDVSIAAHDDSPGKETEETSNAVVEVAPSEADLAKQYVSHRHVAT